LNDLDTTTPAGNGAGRGRQASVAVSSPKPRDAECGRFPTDYVAALQKCGARPYVVSTFELCADEEVRGDVDVVQGLEPDDGSVIDRASGLVLTGGGDIDPRLYGQQPHPRTYNVSPRRDRFELGLLERALAKDMPVLAICRGMQVLNVALGGSLEQHLMDVPGRLDHYRDRPRGEAVHEVHLEPASELADWLGERAPVNSHHHQGLDVVAEPLQEIGRSEDGVLEAVVSRAHSWVVGVQWHPEVMALLDKRQLRIFQAFVDAVLRFEQTGDRSGRRVTAGTRSA
jgi:putative glutamine amidotransferase